MPLPKSGKERGKPTGTEETATGHGGDKNRAIERQNEAARVLAWAGYRVENSPKIETDDQLDKAKDPDYRIEGRIFDCYAPPDHYVDNPLIWKALEGQEKFKQQPRMHRVVEIYALARMEQRSDGTFDEYDDSIEGTSYHGAFLEAQKSHSLETVSNYIRQKVQEKQTRNVVVNLSDCRLSALDVAGYLDTKQIDGLCHVLLLEAKMDAKIERTFVHGTGQKAVRAPDGFTIVTREYKCLDPIPQRFRHTGEEAPTALAKSQQNGDGIANTAALNMAENIE